MSLYKPPKLAKFVRIHHKKLPKHVLSHSLKKRLERKLTPQYHIIIPKRAHDSPFKKTKKVNRNGHKHVLSRYLKKRSEGKFKPQIPHHIKIQKQAHNTTLKNIKKVHKNTHQNLMDSMKKLDEFKRALPRIHSESKEPSEHVVHLDHHHTQPENHKH